MKQLTIILICLLASNCSENNSTVQDQESEWSVYEDGITGEFSLFPLVVNPSFVALTEVDLPDSELVGVISFGSEIRVYPYLYTYEYEVVNDQYNGSKFAFSYCPITKSAVAFYTQQNFRASGYLYYDNVTPWDESTESIWSQMLMRGIRGPKQNERLNTIPVLETTWGVIKNYFPNARTITNLTNSEQLGRSLPPDDNNDDTPGNMPSQGEWTYGIMDNSDHINVFRYSDFTSEKTKNVVIQSQKYIVYGDASLKTINAFKVSDFNVYTVLENEFPYVLKDNSGTKYDILGRGTNGSVLEKPKYAYVAIWKAWDDIFDSFNFQE